MLYQIGKEPCIRSLREFLCGISCLKFHEMINLQLKHTVLRRNALVGAFISSAQLKSVLDGNSE